ncbi:MAG TPA: STAS domain-containing protein [Pseudomonadota bacterium]|nr:STAS domain-containing protein [Pseudomonadota bacterium]
MTEPTNPTVTISGFEIAWDLAQGINLWAGVPTLSMWIPSTVAGLMAGFQSMVGTERFNLCMQVGGQQSVDTDWAICSSAPSFEEGLQRMSEIAWPAGWGRWMLVSLDREAKVAVMRAVNSWEGLYQKALGVCWGSGMMAGKFSGLIGRLLGVGCWAEQTVFAAQGAAYDEFVVRQSQQTPQQRLDELLQQGKASSADLAVALEKLKQEMQERERTSADLREKLQVIERQEESLRTLSVPIVQVWDGVLTVPLMGSLDGQRASEMMERLLAEIVSARARYAILDLTAVAVVDTSTADHLVRIVRAIELLGARPIIAGISPAVAQTMVSLGVDLSRLTTLRNLQEALKACMHWIDEANETSRPQR